MKNRAIIIIAIFSFLSVAGFSQETGTRYSLKNRFSFEYNTGFTYFLDMPDVLNIDLGMGADGIIGFDAYRNMGVFAGWGFNAFGNDYFSLDESGLMYGFQYKNTFKESRFFYLIRAGAIYNHIKIKGGKNIFFDEFSYDSGHSHGLHASGAIEYSLGRGWAVSGSVKYHQFKKTVLLPESELFPGFGETGYNIHLRYMGLRVGLVKNF